MKFQEQIPKKVHGVLLPPGRTAGVQPSVHPQRCVRRATDIVAANRRLIRAKTWEAPETRQQPRGPNPTQRFLRPIRGGVFHHRQIQYCQPTNIKILTRESLTRDLPTSGGVRVSSSDSRNYERDIYIYIKSLIQIRTTGDS